MGNMNCLFSVVSTQHAQPAAWMSAGPDGEPEDNVARECLARQGQHDDATPAV